MTGVSTAEVIYSVGQKHGLNVEQIGLLAEEVGFIMLGMVGASDFITNLQTLLDIPQEKAGEIAQEINHKIFLPIREELRGIYGMNISEEIATTAPTPPVPQATPKSTPPARPAPESEIEKKPEHIPQALRQDTEQVLQRLRTAEPISRPTPPPPPGLPMGDTVKPLPPSVHSIPPPPQGVSQPKHPESIKMAEVEEELKPKLLETLPKEKPLEARIAEKTPPKYHSDPYRESVE